MRKYRILMISSYPPSHSAGLGQSVMDALQAAGHEVDYLTRYSYPNQPSNVIALKSVSSLEKKAGRLVMAMIDCLCQIKGVLKYGRRAKKFIFSVTGRTQKQISNNGIIIPYVDESKPLIRTELILSKINKKYDVIITSFWQDMINSTSLRGIYDKTKCPILIASPDMAPMTGGCYYFGDCRNFAHGCGCCPGLNSNSPNDQSSINYQIKKENYAYARCIFISNTWTCKFAEESKLFQYIRHKEITIDKDFFSPEDMALSRREIGISLHYEFVMMLRSSRDVRKGNIDLAKALRLFLESIPIEERQKCLVLTVGVPYFSSIDETMPCVVRELNTVPPKELVKCYRASNLFLNASYDDAGPSMINQSLMCGTPVVCYDNGVALDVIIDGVSGFKVKTGDYNGLADCILKIYSLEKDKYERLRGTSRELALQHNSPEASVRCLENIISEFVED